MKTYLPSLDGLRGVAALAVVGSHFENLSGISLHLQHSGVAVDFFFILSGFVIAQAYEPRLARGLSWRAYMALRLERLYPAILGGLAVGVAVALADGEGFYAGMAPQFLILPVLWGPVLHGGEVFPLNGPQWSLFFEIAANATHAALHRHVTTARLIGIVALSAAALIATSLHFGGLDVGWGRQNLWGGPPRVIFGFGMGLLLYRLHLKGLAAPKVPYALVAALLVCCLVRPFPEAGLYSVTDPIIVILILPVLVALAVRAPVPPRALKLTLWLGALSYPLYAIHAPLLRGCETLVDHLSDDQGRLGWAIGLPATIVIAALFERFYDAPIRAWLRRRRAAG